jgi:hypothetical protein
VKEETMEKTNVEVFTEAADLIERHGFLQGAFGNPRMGFCVAGAVYYALTGEERGTSRTLPMDPVRDRYVDLLHVIAAVLTPEFGQLGTRGVSEWSDVPGRAAGEAVGLLRALARREAE